MTVAVSAPRRIYPWPISACYVLQRMGLKNLLTLIYMVRVPILALVMLAGMGWLANTIAKSVLANLFDQGTSFWGLCAVCFCGFLLSAVSIVCINNVINYGGARCGEGELIGTENHSRKGIEVGWLVLLLGALPSFLFAGFVWHGTGQLDAGQKLGPTALAFLFATLAGLGAKLVQIGLWPGSDYHETFPPDLVIPLYAVLHKFAWYHRLVEWSPRLTRWFNAKVQQPLRFLERRLGPGYFHKDACDPPSVHGDSGHVYVIGIYVITLGLWVIFGKCKQMTLQEPDMNPFIQFLGGLPPLAWLLMFLIVATLTLSGITFFLDRYRVPSLLVLGVLAWGTGLTPKSDHFFEVHQSPREQGADYWTPGQILQSRIARGTRRFVMVSTAGGGIQAAAWTAKVLDGLEKEVPHFRDSVLVISSVSGGSVGAMAYARTFDENHRAKEFNPVKQAEEGALDAAAWGWFVPDVWRAIEPWTRRALVDRGWAMERAWTSIFQLRSGEHELQLDDWARETQKKMPALILNSSVVETGHPVVFATSRFNEGNDRDPQAAILDFHSIYGEKTAYSYDVSIATATRLSAAFPFVAPAARPNLLDAGIPDSHYVDGGYYDNFGITTLFAWMEKAFNRTKCSDCSFLLLRITHFPDASSSGSSRHGWLYQLYAPVAGLYAARDAGQLAGDNNQVRLEAALRPQITGTAIQFQDQLSNNGCAEPPLSWQLSQGQKDCIESTWDTASRGESNPSLKRARQCVSDFVAGRSFPTCQNLAAEGLAAEETVVPKPRERAE